MSILSSIRPFARCLARMTIPTARTPYCMQVELPKKIGVSLSKGLETRFHTQDSLLARVSSVPLEEEEGINPKINAIFDRYAASSTTGESPELRRKSFEECREEVKRALSHSEEALPASSITIPPGEPNFPGPTCSLCSRL